MLGIRQARKGATVQVFTLCGLLLCDKISLMSFKKSYPFLILFITATIGLNFSVIQTDPILKYDDQLMLYPLEKLESLGEYFKLMFTDGAGVVRDIQPVRDMSYLFNIWLYSQTGLSTFHITNAFITAFFVYVFFLILMRLSFSKQLAALSSLILCTHPLLVSSVAWLSARKHSLAILFFLLALLSYLKKREVHFTTIILFALSVLSHPITILTPLILLATKSTRAKINKNTISLFAVMIIVFGLNIYKAYFLGLNNTGHAGLPLAERVSGMVLSMGRAFQLILLPYENAISYYEASPLNIVGIGVAVLFLYLMFKSLERKVFYLTLFSYGLFLVLTLPFFINDTYLYLPLLLTVYLILNQAKAFGEKNKVVIGMSLVCIFYFSWLSFSYSGKWLSDKEIFLHSYQVEENPDFAIYVASNISDNQNLSMDFLEEGFKRMPSYRKTHIEVTGLNVLVKLDQIPKQRRFNFLKQYFDPSKDREFYHALIYLFSDAESVPKGIAELEALMGQGPVKIKTQAMGLLKKWCTENKHQFCLDNSLI